MKILLIHNYYRQAIIGGEDLVFRRELTDLTEAMGKENVLTYTVNTDNANAVNILLNTFFSIKHFIKVYRIIKKSIQ